MTNNDDNDIVVKSVINCSFPCCITGKFEKIRIKIGGKYIEKVHTPTTAMVTVISSVPTEISP